MPRPLKIQIDNDNDKWRTRMWLLFREYGMEVPAHWQWPSTMQELPQDQFWYFRIIW